MDRERVLNLSTTPNQQEAWSASIAQASCWLRVWGEKRHPKDGVLREQNSQATGQPTSRSSCHPPLRNGNRDTKSGSVPGASGWECEGENSPGDDRDVLHRRTRTYPKGPRSQPANSQATEEPKTRFSCQSSLSQREVPSSRPFSFSRICSVGACLRRHLSRVSCRSSSPTLLIDDEKTTNQQTRRPRNENVACRAKS